MPTGTERLSQACLLLSFVKETAMRKHALPLWCLISPKLGHKCYNYCWCRIPRGQWTWVRGVQVLSVWCSNWGWAICCGPFAWPYAPWAKTLWCYQGRSFSRELEVLGSNIFVLKFQGSKIVQELFSKCDSACPCRYKF